ncbi:eukaryotic porin-domain-containing protein [Russula compacta]|nr:eukaryotic porin-domain-containing protein [Russula compacta]
MAASPNEKSPTLNPYAETSAPSKISSSLFPTFSPLGNAYSRFSSWRAALGLPNPGTVENLQKEVKTTHLTNFIFDGARADLMKGLSMDPAFQVTHSFQWPRNRLPQLTHSVILQGNVDHEGNVSGRFQQSWSASNTSKVQAQLGMQPGHTMIQLEHDYSGQDYSLNAKVINPSPLDGSGIYVGSYLQSVSKNLAMGIETLYQRAALDQAEMSSSYLAKLAGSDGKWIATAQFQPIGVLQATYWHKLSEKVEAAADLQVIAAPMRRDAIATVGTKYDLRMSTFRAQLDSTGKVSALLEQRFAPSFAFTVAGEIDHFKNAAKVGVGVMIESTSLTPEEMGMVPPPGQPHF